MNELGFLGRERSLFADDLNKLDREISQIVRSSSFLVVGGAGTIGQATVLELFRRDPRVLHVVDISENNLVELVRRARSSIGYNNGEFRTFALDAGSFQFDSLLREQGPYDYILNLSALKHVRSEKDPYTLMRMIEVNAVNTLACLRKCKNNGLKKYFSVSTDKAANPVNLMGASKRIMELLLFRESSETTISSARFANVAFSDGSLLHGFNQRFLRKEPISAPIDVRRYFISQQESGELCLLSTIIGENRELLFPKLDENRLPQTSFSDLAVKYLGSKGYDAVMCESEEEARARRAELISHNQWPCYFFESDTTGEKALEEFHTEAEEIDNKKFRSIGVVKTKFEYDPTTLDEFLKEFDRLRMQGSWSKLELVALYKSVLPTMDYLDLGKYLDDRM